MGLDVLFTADVQGFVLAGLVLSIRGAQHQGYDVQYLAGVVAASEHMCLAVKAPWPEVLRGARDLLGTDSRQLLDSALQLTAGSHAR